MRWQVIVPIRPADVGKSRLRPATTSASAHERLVRAIQRDTVDAILALSPTVVAAVTVTTPDPVDTAAVLEHRAVRIVDDRGAPLNAALAAACADVGDDGVLVVLADLPSLQSGDLAAVLDAAVDVERGFVADLGGNGTTMLSSHRAGSLDPRFGPGSAIAHAASGAVSLAAHTRARADVDTAADLRTDIALGVGPSTAQTLAWLRTDGALGV